MGTRLVLRFQIYLQDNKMSTRSDHFTQTRVTPDLFSDFLDDLTPHPISKDLGRVKNDQSIKQARNRYHASCMVKALTMSDFGACWTVFTL